MTMKVEFVAILDGRIVRSAGVTAVGGRRRWCTGRVPGSASSGSIGGWGSAEVLMEYASTVRAEHPARAQVVAGNCPSTGARRTEGMEAAASYRSTAAGYQSSCT